MSNVVNYLNAGACFVFVLNCTCMLTAAGECDVWSFKFRKFTCVLLMVPYRVGRPRHVTPVQVYTGISVVIFYGLVVASSRILV